ncbi:hypothetical protein GCM10007424_02190 [Flavobacterium suaedae]|uniref:Tetratricopeptide repeat protein n=1 Tax=Flavobacterium suaedae TaxID=1767027 RepID=A0ABQ1JD04_9FLAO|nr:hypothetical protein [Flavobacterium suaedae]GGB65819.1 hypothetical protein GCM10007424_02190 [Flavobacterium suaedae]
MNKFLILVLLLLANAVFSQEVIKKSYQIIEPRSIYLNGGMRSEFGGKSRTYIKIDLPPNTVEWYYSFSTSTGKSGIKNLNLALQLSSLLFDYSGITSKIASKVKVPEGSSSLDVYLCDIENIDLFYKKVDNNGGIYRYIREGTVENTKQAVVQINDVTTNTWYLGLKNPSSFDGVNVSIEVVAITAEIHKTPEQERAELYGGIGWTQFENGDYLKCIEYSDKANAEYELGWVTANKGLAQLMLGKESIAMDTYVNAITLIKKQPYSEYVFKEVIKDIDNVLIRYPNIKGAREIKKIIELQQQY